MDYNDPKREALSTMSIILFLIVGANFLFAAYNSHKASLVLLVPLLSMFVYYSYFSQSEDTFNDHDIRRQAIFVLSILNLAFLPLAIAILPFTTRVYMMGVRAAGFNGSKQIRNFVGILGKVGKSAATAARTARSVLA